MSEALSVRDKGNNENKIVRAVLISEWLSPAEVARSINKLCVWWSVGGCAKMTYLDLCTCSTRLFGHVSTDLCAL